MDFVQEARRQSVLKRAQDMARTGWYATCEEIEHELRSSADYRLIRTYFDDAIFCAHLTQLCEEARRTAMDFESRIPRDPEV